MEPFIKPSNALTKVSVSPVVYFYYKDKYNNIYQSTRPINITKIKAEFTNSPKDITTYVILLYNIKSNRTDMLMSYNLKPLTVAEKILYVNE